MSSLRSLDTRAVHDGGAIHTVQYSVIALTIFSAFAAGLVFILVLVDNIRHDKKWWRMPYERRTPFYLAITIILSSVPLVIREFTMTGTEVPFDTNPNLPTSACIALNEATWWGSPYF
jgi:heme/copper-type cytochrome/quinol oxidase subunit 1